MSTLPPIQRNNAARISIPSKANHNVSNTAPVAFEKDVIKLGTLSDLITLLITVISLKEGARMAQYTKINPQVCQVIDE